MSLDALVIFAGAVVAILPFLGFPISWDHALFFILGVCVVALGIAVRRKLHQRKGAREEFIEEQTRVQ